MDIFKNFLNNLLERERLIFYCVNFLNVDTILQLFIYK